MIRKKEKKKKKRENHQGQGGGRNIASNQVSGNNVVSMGVILDGELVYGSQTTHVRL
jgi:hypothetical protein